MKTTVIKKYKNRKLYDTNRHSYVTLIDILKLVKENEEVMVIDNETKQDITLQTLTQGLFEYKVKNNTFLDLGKLREVIREALT